MKKDKYNLNDPLGYWRCKVEKEKSDFKKRKNKFKTKKKRQTQ